MVTVKAITTTTIICNSCYADVNNPEIIAHGGGLEVNEALRVVPFVGQIACDRCGETLQESDLSGM